MDVDRVRRRVEDRLPLVLRDRVVPVRAALGVALLAAVAVVVLLVRLVVQDAGSTVVLPPRAARSVAVVAPAPTAPAGSPSAPPAAPVAPAAVVVVDVVGRVRRPGLRTLPVGARVADAVAAAGGAVPGAALQRINLARRLADGEQVVVPGPDDLLAGAGSPPGPSGGSVPPAGPLDLNSATAADLDALPGVGPVLAGRIVSWREQHQRFSRVEELGEVSGIGPRVLERLRPLVRV